MLDPPPPALNNYDCNLVFIIILEVLIEKGRAAVSCDANSGEGQGSGSRGEQGAGGYGRREKKGRAAGSLRWREAGEKFKKASFRYLLLLIIQSKKRTQQRFLTSI